MWLPDAMTKAAMLSANPDVFFTTPHFDGHPSVLVRGSRIGEIDLDELTELVQDAWLVQASARRGQVWLASR